MPAPSAYGQNVTAIVWLYRGESHRFVKLVESYLDTANHTAAGAKAVVDHLRAALEAAFMHTAEAITGDEDSKLKAELDELEPLIKTLGADLDTFNKDAAIVASAWAASPRDNTALHSAWEALEPLANTCRDLGKQTDHLFKLLSRLHEAAVPKTASGRPKANGGTKLIEALDIARHAAAEHLRRARHFHTQAGWLQQRFPDAKLVDVQGLVKLVDRSQIEANDWSLAPGRYVGVSPEDEDEDFDFEQTLRDIHIEVEGLNAEAVDLAAQIKRSFEELGI
jgi:type I restriction enzyme M protein